MDEEQRKIDHVRARLAKSNYQAMGVVTEHSAPDQVTEIAVGLS